MATIDSVELYLSQSGADPGDASLVVEIHGAAAYTTRPNYGSSLGSKSLDISTFPTHGNQDWVTFTFDTPITISDTNFYGVYVYGTGNAFDLAGVRLYESSGSWSDASGGSPYTGKERFWQYTISTTTWSQTGGSCAYKINCTDCTDNTSDTPDGTYVTSFNNYRYGVRSYLDAASTPSKPTNPDPADDATDVDFSDLILDWDDGGGADTFDVYVGDAADNLTLIVSGTALTTRTLTSTQRDDLFTDHCYWRIDATNEQGTTTGDVWDFVVAGPGKAKTPVPNDGQEGIYIAGIDRITEVSWSAPEGETPTYKVYLTLPGGSPTLLETTDFLAHIFSSDILDALDYFSLYEWRVDTYDPVSELTTTGDTWTFISMKSHRFTDFFRPPGYDEDKVWEPETGWVDIDSFEYTGSGRYKNQLVVIGHNCIYFGDL